MYTHLLKFAQALGVTPSTLTCMRTHWASHSHLHAIQSLSFILTTHTGCDPTYTRVVGHLHVLPGPEKEGGECSLESMGVSYLLATRWPLSYADTSSFQKVWAQLSSKGWVGGGAAPPSWRRAHIAHAHTPLLSESRDLRHLRGSGGARRQPAPTPGI